MTDSPINRWLVFGGDRYYPTGGWFDLRGSFDDLDRARAIAVGLMEDDSWDGVDWAHVVDLADMKVVERFGPGYG